MPLADIDMQTASNFWRRFAFLVGNEGLEPSRLSAHDPKLPNAAYYTLQACQSCQLCLNPPVSLPFLRHSCHNFHTFQSICNDLQLGAGMEDDKRKKIGQWYDEFESLAAQGKVMPIGETHMEKIRREWQEKIAAELRDFSEKADKKDVDYAPGVELVALGKEYRILLNDIKRMTPANHWLGDFLKVFFDHDNEAAERLIDNFYSENALIARKRRTLYRYWMNKLLTESGYSGSKESYKKIWKPIAIAAVILALSLDEYESDKAQVYYYLLAEGLLNSGEDESLYLALDKLLDQAIRRETRKTIEKDLTNGSTLDSRDVLAISGNDKKGKKHYGGDIDSSDDENAEGPNIVDTETIQNALDWMQFQMDNKDGKTVRADVEDNIETVIRLNIGNLLDGVFYEDKLILLTDHGEMGKLAKRLARTPNALYQRKNVLIQQLLEKTKSPPKIPKS